ncbi:MULTISPECIES: response regulator transcription factor [Streptomyces]|uniref:DNA-binding NarL/FixJ family response regulator n=1 Tax=Streptomyces demainii TaxID=588122 RepID=A0ABT9KSU6_9ACTN|nr:MULTISPECIES: response regulator transcription factor [Streptomyces]MBW8092709.1 response regulator transcription factor [Streptomyces hygroscopicus subsp. hygroscopicus]MCO8306278.1 response regulator transcription factor [Streptomyces sp. RKCA744]MDN3056460.1 response regulator transcription factor [Streptomyces sp. SRF1]MDP9611419.1 DNA-binding NarL/FixJ family response regulator [Streptomyces demainii]
MSSIEKAPQVALARSEGGAQVDVVVVFADTVNTTTMDLLGKFEKPAGGFVLIVGNKWNADYSEAADLRVRAVLWRSDFSHAKLINAICLVNSGGAYFPASLQGDLLDHVQRVQKEILAPRGLTSSGLTSREIDVLRLAAEGYGIAEISRELSYSERTIKNIFYGLMKQLNLKNRTHVVSYAIRAGVI